MASQKNHKQMHELKTHEHFCLSTYEGISVHDIFGVEAAVVISLAVLYQYAHAIWCPDPGQSNIQLPMGENG